MNKRQGGFGLPLALALLAVVAVLGLIGWIVWQRSAQPATAHTRTGAVVMKYSRLSFLPDHNIWHIDVNASQVDPNCGKQDNLSLSKVGSVFTVAADFGVCGKGGSTCADVKGCVSEAKELASVKLSATQTAYIVANRYAFPDDTPAYGLWLTTGRTCLAGNVCVFEVPNFQSNPGTITGFYEGAGQLPGNPKTLAEFINLPDVQDAVDLFKTAQYE